MQSSNTHSLSRSSRVLVGHPHFEGQLCCWASFSWLLDFNLKWLAQFLGNATLHNQPHPCGESF